MNSELLILNSLHTVDFDTFQKLNIDETRFLLYDNIYKFCIDHYGQYKKFPAPDTIKKHFSDFEVLALTEPIEFYAKELEEDYTKQQLINTLKATAEDLQANDLDSALEKLHTSSRTLGEKLIAFSAFDLNKIADERIKRYDELKKQKGLLGLETGVEKLNDVFGGYQAGSLYGVFANRKVGKTWFLLYSATNLFKLGYKILFFTKEQVKDIIAHRAEAIMFSIPYERFSNYTLTKEEEEKYKKDRKDFSSNGMFEIIDNTKTGKSDIFFVERMIEAYQPDIVFLDGLALYGKNNGTNVEWTALTELSRTIKQIAMRQKIPVVYSAHYSRKQSRENKRKNVAMDLDEIAFADAFGQDCDGAIGLFQNEAMKARNRMDFYIMAARESDTDKFSLQWDVGNMNIGKEYIEDVKFVLDDTDDDDDITASDIYKELAGA